MYPQGCGGSSPFFGTIISVRNNLPDSLTSFRIRKHNCASLDTITTANAGQWRDSEDERRRRKCLFYCEGAELGTRTPYGCEFKQQTVRNILDRQT